MSEEIQEQGTGGLEHEKARRLAALATMRDAGTNPYPYRFDRSHTLGEIRRDHDSLEPGTETDTHVSVAGRIMLKRDQGKLIFATLQDRTDPCSCLSREPLWATTLLMQLQTSTSATGWVCQES